MLELNSLLYSPPCELQPEKIYKLLDKVPGDARGFKKKIILKNIRCKVLFKWKNIFFNLKYKIIHTSKIPQNQGHWIHDFVGLTIMLKIMLKISPCIDIRNPLNYIYWPTCGIRCASRRPRWPPPLQKSTIMHLLPTSDENLFSSMENLERCGEKHRFVAIFCSGRTNPCNWEHLRWRRSAGNSPALEIK